MGDFLKFDYHQLISFPQQELTILDKLKIPLHAEKSVKSQISLKKALFFVFREGIIRSYYKFRSAKIYKECTEFQYFVVVSHNVTGKYYCGLQLSVRQPIFYFLSANIFSVKPDINQFKEIYLYNPFVGYITSSGENKLVSSSFLPMTLKKTLPEGGNKKSLYIVGGGRYVLTEILPVFRSYNLKGICEFNFELLQSNAFNEFELKTNDFDVLLEFAQNDFSEKLFIIASYHSYHTEQTIKALQLSNTRVLIEKPPCISFEDYNNLLGIYDQNNIYIAYHRRFAAWNIKIKNILLQNDSPLFINMMIHEIIIPDYHWYFAPNQGSRISGNLCHWIDLTFFWIRQKPVRLSITRNSILGIDYSVYNILFENGTLVNYIPSDLGNGLHGVQEYITIRGKDLEINLSDHLHLRIWQYGKTDNNYRIRRDKGHVRLNKYYTKYVQAGIPSPYSREDFILTTFTYIKFVEMWNNNIDIFDFKSDFFTGHNI